MVVVGVVAIVAAAVGAVVAVVVVVAVADVVGQASTVTTALVVARCMYSGGREKGKECYQSQWKDHVFCSSSALVDRASSLHSTLEPLFIFVGDAQVLRVWRDSGAGGRRGWFL